MYNRRVYMIIETEIKQSIKNQRLDQYRKTYFSLYVDKVALLANGDTVGAENIQKRMDAVEASYIAVEAIIVE